VFYSASVSCQSFFSVIIKVFQLQIYLLYSDSTLRLNVNRNQHPTLNSFSFTSALSASV
ncbi:MAG: hypothetical protein ACI9T9_002449, partial [Oleiphilaceae bacterium]